MTVDELIAELQKIKEMGNGDNGDMPVCVRVTNCLSSHTSVPISYIGRGSDWERGRVMISPEHPLERYYTDAEIIEQKRLSEEMRERLIKSRKSDKE